MRKRVILRWVMVCLAAGVVLPSGGAAQEPRLVGRVADDVRVQIDAFLDSARALGLPVEPLVDRALEGAAKGAPGDLIVRAVGRLSDELGLAQGAFGDDATAGELSAGASALRAGATRDDLVRLRTLRPDQPLTVAAGVLADLVAVGVPADTAIAAVLALAPTLDDGQYIAFRRSVEQDIALGASPSVALTVRFGLTSADAVAPESPFTGSTDNRVPPPRKRKP